MTSSWGQLQTHKQAPRCPTLLQNSGLIISPFREHCLVDSKIPILSFKLCSIMACLDSEPLTGIFNRCDHWLHLMRLTTHGFSSFVSVQKTRIQISSEYGALGMSGTVKKVVSGKGVGTLWRGVNAAWLHEASYTSLRLGLYEPCKIAFGCTTPENTIIRFSKSLPQEVPLVPSVLLPVTHLMY